jgi:hypothetical protein
VWLRKAHDVLHAAEINIVGAFHSEYLTKARASIKGAEGTLDSVIGFYELVLKRPGFADSALLKESLADALMRRGTERFRSEPGNALWKNDFAEAEGFLSPGLANSPYDARRIKVDPIVKTSFGPQ